jgi:hypothetical protein
LKKSSKTLFIPLKNIGMSHLMPCVDRNVLQVDYQQANFLGHGCFNTNASGQSTWCVGFQKVSAYPSSLTCQHGTTVILLYSGQKCLSALDFAILSHLSAHITPYKFCTLKASAICSKWL